MLRLGEGLDGEIGQSVQPCEAPTRQVGELAVLDAQIFQLAQVMKTSVVQPRPVSHQLGALDGERHGPQRGNHGEIGLVKLGVYRPEE